MEEYCATSDVKRSAGENLKPPCTGLASGVLPEVQKPVKSENSLTGVSTKNVPSGTAAQPHQCQDSGKCWYALRTTYGREKKAYDYLVGKNIDAFLPTLKSVKVVGGRYVTIEKSRIPNVFFAHGTKEELESFVYDNANLPFLRFYCRHTHVGNKVVSEPLVIPDSQMNSLRIICAVDSGDVIASAEEIERFKSGQKVRIIAGRFRGVTGMVARYRSQQRVGLVINGLLTVCTAYVPSAFIEKI